MQQPIKLNHELSIDETQVILNVLGKMPTESNVWLLHQKIKMQAEQQLKAMQEAEKNGAVESGKGA